MSIKFLWDVGGQDRDSNLQERVSHLWGSESKNLRWWFGLNPSTYLLSNGVLGLQWEILRVVWYYDWLGLPINL